MSLLIPTHNVLCLIFNTMTNTCIFSENSIAKTQNEIKVQIMTYERKSVLYDRYLRKISQKSRYLNTVFGRFNKSTMPIICIGTKCGTEVDTVRTQICLTVFSLFVGVGHEFNIGLSCNIQAGIVPVR